MLEYIIAKGGFIMKREIANKADFDNLVEKIEGCLTWYEKRNFD